MWKKKFYEIQFQEGGRKVSYKTSVLWRQGQGSSGDGIPILYIKKKKKDYVEGSNTNY